LTPTNDPGWFFFADMTGLTITITNVPEPAALGLLGFGIAAMVALRRRQRPAA
jgi:hypothetical protein